MENFQSLGLHESLLHALISMKYETPTPIQAQTIPAALEGRDILGTAQTGTGKTAAYGIPLVSYLLASEKNTALVLAPTRELAIQVLALLGQMLGRKSNIKSALIIGGDSMTKQLNQLQYKPRLIVGTPGRINDHLDRGTLTLDNAKFLVLDETDRMLDMGFGIQIEQIAKALPYKRQTLMFSATLPNNIQNMASKYLKDAIRVTVGSTIAAADTIKQEIIRTSELDKHGVLLEQLNLRSGSCIIFVKTKIATEKLANKLREHGHSADAIHGDLRQRNREKVIRAFRNKKHRILVATDVAARGLDIPHIEHVVNYDLPQCEEDFIHRIGRTGRAGIEGSAVSLITPEDHSKWRNICKMMNPGVKLDASFDDPKNSHRTRNNRRPSKTNHFKFENSSTKRPAMRSEDGNTRRKNNNNNLFGMERKTEANNYLRWDNSDFRPRTKARTEYNDFPKTDRRQNHSSRTGNASNFKRFEDNTNVGSKFGKMSTNRGANGNSFANHARRPKRPNMA